MREGIAAWLNRQPDLIVVGEAPGAAEALSQAQRLQPDLVLCDLSLKGRNGLELVKDLRSLLPELPILILSMHEEPLYAVRAARAGARGYVQKKAPAAELVAAIRAVLGGSTAFPPAIAQLLLDELIGLDSPRRESVHRLTDREFEILHLLGEGQTTHTIAHQMNLSARTIETYRTRIRHKLKLKSLPDLIRFAVKFVAHPRLNEASASEESSPRHTT